MPVPKGENLMLLHNNERPLDFRAQDVTRVMQSLLAGRSCALIGVDGVGKTSLMRHLVMQAVREQYLADYASHFIFLSLDSHELSEPSALAYYRQMAFLLESVLIQHGIERPSDNALLITNEEIAKQVLLERIGAIAHVPTRPVIVFFFDEFDVALTDVEAHFFSTLQAVRNRAQSDVYYVIAISNKPALLCDEERHEAVSKMFEDLFDSNIWGIKPLGERDASAMVERLWRRATWTALPCTDEIRQHLLTLTGAHPGLLKAVVTALVEGSVSLQEYEALEQAGHTLLGNAFVESKCEQLWKSLSRVEQYCLLRMRHGEIVRAALANGQYAANQVNEAMNALLLKGVVLKSDEHAYRCFSPLLTAYVRRLSAPHVSGLQLDVFQRQVYIDGEARPRSLAKKEFKLLEFLASCAGKVCLREETSKAIYGEDYASGRDDGRLDALVERTREHIGDDPRNPRFLETVRGVGHRLNEYSGELHQLTRS